MRKPGLTNFLIASSAFLLIIVFLILGLVLNDFYTTLTKLYYNFLQKVGYYQHIYDPGCSSDDYYCFFINLPDQAPYLLFVLLPVAGSIALFYYYLGDDKTALKRQLKSFFSKTADDNQNLGIIDLNNKKHHYFFVGLLIAFFLLIGIFFVLPLLVLFFK